MSQNRRNFSRVDFQAKTTLVIDAKKFPAQLVDLSLRGALVEITGEVLPLNRNEACQMNLSLNNGSIRLQLKAVLVYRNENNYGFRFDEIDLDALTHIRRLVELNLGDADQVRKELFFLVSHH